MAAAPAGGRSPLGRRQEDPSLQRGAPTVRAVEQRRLRLLEPHLDVLIEGNSSPVVGRDVVPPPALLGGASAIPAPLPEVVLPPHPEEEGPAPEPGRGALCRSRGGASAPLQGGHRRVAVRHRGLGEPTSGFRQCELPAALASAGSRGLEPDAGHGVDLRPLAGEHPSVARASGPW